MSLWGAIQTPYMTPAGQQLSTVATATTLPLMAQANATTPYYQSIYPTAPTLQPASILPLGAMENGAVPRYQLVATAGNPVNSKSGILPLTTAQNQNKSYFTT